MPARTFDIAAKSTAVKLALTVVRKAYLAPAAVTVLLLSAAAPRALTPRATVDTVHETAAIAVQTSPPAVTGSVDAGRRLALNLCWTCHVVAPDQEFQPFLNPPAPAFRRIANKSGVTAASLEHFLKTRHRGVAPLNQMPSPELTDEQVADVVSFLMSLRGHR